MNTSHACILTIDKVIENLYQTFACYPLDTQMDACSCCVRESQQDYLRSTPLRQLLDMSDYSFNAISTWGSTQDFKHFLPRIFELCVVREGNRWPDIEVIFGKLLTEHDDGDWRNWPTAEQLAIRDYFRAGWRSLLNQEIPQDEPDSWLCGMARIGEDLQFYLDYWINARSLPAYEHLNKFACRQIFDGSFWDAVPRANIQFLAWLVSPITIKKLKDIVIENPTADFVLGLLDTIISLNNLAASGKVEKVIHKCQHRALTHIDFQIDFVALKEKALDDIQNLFK